MSFHRQIASFRCAMAVKTNGAVVRTVAVVMALVPLVAVSEDRPRELPKDGAWARYFAESEMLAPEKRKFGSTTVLLSFVGTVDDGGEKCRWIERKETVGVGDDSKSEIIKVLVPEKDLWESDVPFEHFRRGWVLRVNGQISEVQKSQQVVLHLNFAPLLLWTPGMLKDSKLDPDQVMDVAFQKGLLKGAQSRTGKLALPINDYDFSKYAAWQHPDLPIGCAEVHMTREFFRNGKKSRESLTVFRIQETGADAKSSLPDQN
ncbi:MAG: hypothetical protein HY290_13925 [Planctomycetia bacterium]|nr:hypothetical protein [Planctomycetia bacterium]